MKLGSSDISKVYLGSTEVTKAYLGSTLVHEGKTIIDQLKDLGCVMWFPLKASGQLSDVIGGKSITISGTAIKWDSTRKYYVQYQGNANTTQGTISTGWTSDDFPDGEWTTVMMAKRYVTSSYRGYAQIFLVNGAIAIMCVDATNITGATANWTDDNWHTCITVCTQTGSKIYVDDELVSESSTTRQQPWGYATMTIGTVSSGYNNKRMPFKNALIFNKALSATEVAQVRQLINK